MDNLTIEQRRKNMRNIKSKDTKPEIIFRKALWKRGIRFRKNVKDVMGKPDICIKNQKLAIFIDSEFWHGKMYLEGKVPQSNQAYWIPKLERNIKRDKEVNQYLEKNGWKVFRFWSKDVEKNLELLVNKIFDFITSKNNKRRNGGQ